MQWGGVERGRISSAAQKRAIRMSDSFAREMAGYIGIRTTRMAEAIVNLVNPTTPAERAAAFKAVASFYSGGKDDKKLLATEKAAAKKAAALKKADPSQHEASDDAPDENSGDENIDANGKKKVAAGAALGKVGSEDDEVTHLRIKQLIYISTQEIEAAAAIVRRKLAGEAVSDAEIKSVVKTTTESVDVAMFGRMFADRSDLRMTAAVQVGHPFTVGQAISEADFYVAVDDLKPSYEDVGGAFLGDQLFTAGLFYGYARIDMNLLARNLGGNEDMAKKAACAFLKAALTVSPSGKVASFGSNARATWAMVERGSSAGRSLAGAFLKPVTGEDHHFEAVRRVEELAKNLSAAYNEDWVSASMDVIERRGSLAELLAIVDPAHQAH
jgi:CRISPR system Cascade subunit CasC